MLPGLALGLYACSGDSGTDGSENAVTAGSTSANGTGAPVPGGSGTTPATPSAETPSSTMPPSGGPTAAEPTTVEGADDGGGMAGAPPMDTADPPSNGGSPGVGGALGDAGTANGGAPAGGSPNAGGSGGEAVSGSGGMPEVGGSGGAGGSGGGAAGADPGGGDTPCPTNGDPCKILPLGDSITDGIGFSGGYRVELFRLALAGGHSITYVGGSQNGPMTVEGETFPRNHEGHSGWTIDQIDGIVPAPALDDDPHIILLHIGTNDMYQTPAGAPDRLGTLIDQILEDNPDALLVVSNIIPFPESAGVVSDFNSAVPGVVQERIDAGARLLFVDQFDGFPENELGDGVHPNEAGYSRMAGVWFEAIESYLP